MTFMLHSIKLLLHKNEQARGTVLPLRSPHHGGNNYNSTNVHHYLYHHSHDHHCGLRNTDDGPCRRLFAAAVLALHTLTSQLIYTKWIVYIVRISPNGVPLLLLLRGQRHRQLDIETLRR